MVNLRKAWVVGLTMFAAILFYVPDGSLDLIVRRDILLRWALTIGVGALFIEELFLLSFWVWICFCMVINDNQIATLFMNIMLLFLFFYLGIKKLRDRDVSVIFNFIAVIVLAHAALMVLQYYDVKTWFYVLPKYKETFIPGAALNTNEGGALLGISLPVFFRKRWCYGLIAVIPALVVQRAFAAIIVAAVVIFMFFVITYKDKIKIIIPVSALLISLSVFAYMKNCDGSYLNKSGYKDRIRIWRQTAQQLQLRSPIRGFGLGSYPYIYPVMAYKIYKEKDFSPEIFKWDAKETPSLYRAHNDWLELAFDSGWIGLLIFANWIVYSLIFYIKNPIKTLNTNIASLLVIGACVSSSFHFLFRTPACLIPIAGMAIMNSYQENNREVIDGEASL